MERKTTDDESSKKEEIEEEMKKEDVDRMHSRLIRSFTQDHIQTYQIQSRRTSANHSLKTLLHIYKQQKQEISGLQKMPLIQSKNKNRPRNKKKYVVISKRYNRICKIDLLPK